VKTSHLGFNGLEEKTNTSLIAVSSREEEGGTEAHAARPMEIGSRRGGKVYWLEDLDVQGKKIHVPFYEERGCAKSARSLGGERSRSFQSVIKEKAQ